MKTKQERKLESFETTKSDTYKTINVTGVFGGLRPGFFEVVVFSDEMKIEKALETNPPNPEKIAAKRTIECRLILNPFQAKSLSTWLQGIVEDYEKQFGEIRMITEVEKQFGEMAMNRDEEAIMYG